MEISRFTIRVYGLLLNEKQEVLLVHEKMPDLHFTKFPGGGLEFGEGTHDCLIREFKEETGVDIFIDKHLYTTDFFQPSAFLKSDQLMAIYYSVKQVNTSEKICLDEKQITIGSKTEYLHFYWRSINNFDVSELTFPIDKIVAGKFLNDINL
ncbi:MAG: NUDIX hydrolase [Bacteroidia bacterium]|nr:NUDIX hydrolase [Bacteroidia bacterium]